tara:strand:- start:1208 stop:2149 length:942 start_codon:yes stop_codon:yes gene_type:complete
MALPALTDFVTWAGSKFKNTGWDSNIQTLVNVFTNGAYDLNVRNIACNDITANSINVSITNGLFPGFVMPNFGTYTPNLWLPMNGGNNAIATYPDLFYAWGHTYGPGDGTPVTATSFNIVGNVCTITKAVHGLSNLDYASLKFTDAPSGVVINRGGQVSNVTTDTFDMSIAGWAEQPQGTVVYTEATTFPVGDTRGRLLRGIDTTATIDPGAASRTDRGDGTTGAQVGTPQDDELESHNHELVYSRSGSNPVDPANAPYIPEIGSGADIYSDVPQRTFKNAEGYSGNKPILRTGGSETRPVNFGVNYIVFTGV